MTRKQIKNLKVNVKHFVFIVSLGISCIALHNDVSAKNEQIIAYQEEIKNNEVDFTNPIIANFGSVNIQIPKEENIEVLEIEQNQQKTKPVEELDEQIEILTNQDIETLELNYSGMNLDHNYENYIMNLCDKYSKQYGIDYDTLYKVVMTIGYRESDGEWNNNGRVSSTGDYGEFQINQVNHGAIMEHFNWATSKEEMSGILRYDREKNAEAAVWLVTGILNNRECHSIEDAFGIYNGWVNWREKPLAISYSQGCMQILNEYFDSNKTHITK